MGIVGHAPDTYDYWYRQHIRDTTDVELKRLFVLRHLHRELDFALSDYELGRIRIGKVQYRPFTDTERQEAHDSLITRIADLAAYTAFTNYSVPILTLNERVDLPVLPKNFREAAFIDELRVRVSAVQHTNAATKPVEPTGTSSLP